MQHVDGGADAVRDLAKDVVGRQQDLAQILQRDVFLRDLEIGLGGTSFVGVDPVDGFIEGGQHGGKGLRVGVAEGALAAATVQSRIRLAVNPPVGIDGKDPFTGRQIGNVGALEINSKYELDLRLVA